MRFEANKGQTDSRVKFITRGSHHSFFLTPNEAVLSIAGRTEDGGATAKSDVVRMRLEGASTEPKVDGQQRLPGMSNYLFGKDPRRWVTGVPSYAKVRYRSVYPGVDLLYYGNEKGQLEYDFVVAPGVDPSSIKLTFDGQRSLNIDAAGDLVLSTASNEVRQRKPTLYQEVAGGRRSVTGAYVLDGANVHFEIGSYDRRLPLVIDPVLTYSTYLGGSGNDDPTGMVVDASGSAYLTGSTTSIDFPMSTGSSHDKTCGQDGKCDPGDPPPAEAEALREAPVPKSDVFVAKVSADGSHLEYSTYLGGTETDQGLDIAVHDGGAYVAGVTNSPNFPTSPNGFDRACGSDGLCDERLDSSDTPGSAVTKSDAFMARLSRDGSRLEYSTFLGGSGDDGVRAGPTWYKATVLAPDQPREEMPERVTGGRAQNGPHPGPAMAVALDEAGAVYLTGATLSHDFAPVAKIMSLPGSGRPFDPYDPSCGTDGACTKTYEFVAFGERDRWVQFHPDAFVVKIDTTKAGDQSIGYASYLGGSGGEAGLDIAVASSGSPPRPQAYLTGFSYSPAAPEMDSFPTTTGGFQPSKPLAIGEQPDSPVGDWNVSRARSVPFVTRMDLASAVDEVIAYSTFLGGSQPDQQVTANGGYYILDSAYSIAADPAGNAYVAGATDSLDFPTSTNAVQAEKNVRDPNPGATSDAFVAKLDTYKSAGDSLAFSTFLGGIDQDVARGLSVDALGRTYVTGHTASTVERAAAAGKGLFPLVDPVQDAPPRVSNNCGSYTQASEGGNTASPLCRDGFLSVLESDGGALAFSTFMRGDRYHPDGNAEDVGQAVSAWMDPVTEISYAYVTGRTGTNDFPSVAAFQPEAEGYTDSFLAKISLTDPPGPYLRAVVPASGISTGGTLATITGSGLKGTRSVSFGGVAGRIVEVNNTQVKAETPPGIGTVDVRVTTPLGTSPVSSLARFRYFDGKWESWEPAATGAPVPPTARYGHTASLLVDNPETARLNGLSTECGAHCGKILMAGGNEADKSVADLYTPASGVSVSVCSTTCPASKSTATPLPDGSVLFVSNGVSNGTAYRYTPTGGPLGTWEDVTWRVSAGTQTVSNTPTGWQVPTLITGTEAMCGGNCDKVLVPSVSNGRSGSASALYDYKNNTWAFTGSPVNLSGTVEAPGIGHTATLITGTPAECGQNCGKVLFVGGYVGEVDPKASGGVVLYDPKTGTWAERAAVGARFGHTATRLSSGKVLIAGGIFSLGGSTTHVTGRTLRSAEIYDPLAPSLEEAFSNAEELLEPRSGHVAIPLSEGRVLVMGGSGDVVDMSEKGTRAPLDTAEIFDPNLARGKGGWRSAKNMIKARGHGPQHGGHTATALAGENCGEHCGKVMVFGGTATTSANMPKSGDALPRLAAPELYTAGPQVTTFTPVTGPASGGPADMPVTILGAGFVPGNTTVTFGEVTAQSVTVHSPNRITAVSPPASEAEAVNIRVSVPGLGLSVSSGKFTYTGLPGRVTDLVADSLSGSQVRLGFSAPGMVENVGGPATDYVIKQSRTPLSADNFDSATSLCEGGVCRFTPTRRGLGLTLAVDGLTPETTYYYALRARNGAGQLGPMSNVAEVLTGTVAPGAVSDLTATSVGEGKVELTFSAPGSNGVAPPPASRYIVKQSLDPISEEDFEAAPALCADGVCSLAPAAVGDRLSISVDNLARDTTYHYRLQALDAAGNRGPLSNAASTTPGCVAASAGTNQLAYQAGYSLVGLPEGTVVPAQSSLYGWFDLGKGGRYSVQHPTRAVTGGHGYWAWFSCARLVTLPGAGTSSTRSSLAAYRASMVGNPSGTRPATVTGHDFTARWDPTLNAGAGGYRVSGYQQPQQLAVGEGIWAFSYRRTTITIDAP